jgi:hypothetical protein
MFINFMVKIIEHLNKNYDKNQFLRLNENCLKNSVILYSLRFEKIYLM